MVIAAIEGLALLLLLACPVAMGLMMWFMGRGMKGHHRSEQPSSLSELKGEQARLAEKIEALERQPAAQSEQRPRDDAPETKEGCC